MTILKQDRRLWRLEIVKNQDYEAYILNLEGKSR
jgi:hypothetical protein